MNIINLFNLDLTFQDEISILKQIYNAIKAYSNCKIIHNDLFPRNILIKNSNIITPIISDFGYSLIDKESYILTDNKYKKDIDNILYNMNAHENDDITKYINIIYDYNCNFVVDKKSYNNISIYKKDIITITNSVSILSNKKETKNVCESVINKIMNFNIYSFDELKLFLNDILNYI
jgi:serine/threonine protein kinase